jgi:hypothetical protein
VNTLKVKLVKFIMVVNIVLKFQSPLQVIMVFMPIGNSKWSTAKVKIALKTYELHFRNLIENHFNQFNFEGVHQRNNTCVVPHSEHPQS